MKKSLIFVLFMVVYLFICTVVILAVKDGLSAIRHRYYFGAYCSVIKEQFTDEATFHSYAELDR